MNLVPDSGLVAISVLPLNKVAKGKDYNLFYAPKGEHKGAATPFARQESSIAYNRVAAAGLIVAIAFWLNSAATAMEGSAAKATTTAISIWGIHNPKISSSPAYKIKAWFSLRSLAKAADDFQINRLVTPF